MDSTSPSDSDIIFFFLQLTRNPSLFKILRLNNGLTFIFVHAFNAHQKAVISQTFEEFGLDIIKLVEILMI